MKLPFELSITDRFQKKWNFDTLEAFELFIQSQLEFWSQRQGLSAQSQTAGQYIQRFNGFQAILNQINSWRPQLETWDESTFRNNFTSLINNQIGTSWIWSSHPFVEKWIELTQLSVDMADAFFEAITHQTTSRSNSFQALQGYLIAYEFLYQDGTNINKRRTSEVKSLNQLRDQLAEKNNELIGTVDLFKTDISAWQRTTQSDFHAWHTTQKNLLNETILAQSKNFQSQLASWTNKHTDLEKKYREELRFESPAKYWGDKAISFKEQGRRWFLGLVISIVIGVAFFSKYFITWLEGKSPDIGLQNIEGIVIFATILSSFAFLVRSLSKMTFSSFHLMRDAEEREQLTHLYLSLRDGNDDDPESRRIILQALFSRSESGLLSGDHSPTMPTVQDAIKIIKP